MARKSARLGEKLRSIRLLDYRSDSHRTASFAVWVWTTS